MTSVTTSWQDPTLYINVSAALNDSAAGGETGMAAAAVIGAEKADPEVTANVTVAMAAMDAAMATSGGGDRHALLYIVVVLAFYAIGIIAALTMYLRQERADIDEEKVYDDYAAIHRDPWKWARYYRMQQVMTRLHSLKMENEQRHTRDDGQGGNGQHTDEGHQLNSDELDELTIDIPRLLGEGGATKRMALPDGETVVVTFRMPNADSGFRLSRPSSLIRKRYETIDEERESVTDSDKSSHLGENGTTADNELSDDSIKERQRLRLGTGRSSKRKRSFEQPLLKSRYDRVEKNEFNILDDEKDLDDASSETGFEPSDNGAILRTWGIKPRISRWSDCMDLSEMTSSPTDDHSSGNLLSSIGSPCRDDPVDIDLEKANVSTITIPNVSSVKPKNPPVTIQYVIDEHSDINQNRRKSRTGDLYSIPPVPTVDADFDSDPTSLESTHKRQNFGACDLRWKAENKKFLKLPTSSSGTFKSSKPTDIDAAYKEMSKPFSHNRMIYDLLEANYSRSLPFLSAKGKPTDLDSVSQLLTVNTEDVEGGMMHGIRCSSSPSIPNCKASDIFQFARPDSTESHFYDQEVSSPLLAVPGGAPRFRHEGIASSTDGSISSLDNMLDDITVTLPEPNRIQSAPTGLILQPHEYIIKNTYNVNSVPPLIPASSSLKVTTPPEAKPMELSNKIKPASLSSSFSKSGSFHSSCEEALTVNVSDDSKADMKSLTSLHSLTRENSIELPKSPNIGQYDVKDLATTQKEKAVGVIQIPSTESLSDESLGLSDIENSPNNPPIEINIEGSAGEVGKVKPEPSKEDTVLKAPQPTTSTSPACGVNANRQGSGMNAQQRDNTAQQSVSEGKAGSIGVSHSGIDTSLTAKTSGADSGANRMALNRDKAADRRPGTEPVWTYPKISEKSEGGVLEDEGTSGEYTSCDEISLLADDFVYASNERVNTDFEDEDDDEEADDISDEFASETFTELEKLADEGSIDNLVDDQCCTPDGSDLPLDLPRDDNGGSYSDLKLPYGIRPRPEGESQSTFTDAKMSSAEEIIKKWIADNMKAGEMKSAKAMGVRSSIPKLTNPSSGSYVQSSKRETTFLPDSHKCVSESTLGDVISDSRGAAAKPGPAKAAAAKAGPTKPGAARGSTAGVAPTTRGPSAPLHRKIPPAPARGGNFANSGASSLAATRSLMARPTTAPLTRLKSPGVRGRAASSVSAYTKGSYQSPGTTSASGGASEGKNSAAGATPKQTYSKQELNSAKYRPATTGAAAAAAANGSLANRRRPNTAMDRSSTVGASTPVGTRPKQQQGPGGKFTSSKLQQPTALSKTQPRPRTQIGKSDAKATGSIMQLGHKLNKTGTSATNAQGAGAKTGGTRVQGGPHNVHGATSMDMTPRTARRLTSRVTTI